MAPPPLHRQLLHDGWTVTQTAPDPDHPPVASIDAEVPGCVHTDLLSAGLIDDPDIGTAEADQHWVGRSGWTYSRRLDLLASREHERHERIDLVCDGLDTVATVTVGGQVVGQTHNMHTAHRFDLSALSDVDELSVRFDPVDEWVASVREEVGVALPTPYPESGYPYVRKMACNFGWDWGPTLITAGIWRSIAVETWSGARIASVRPLAGVDGSVGTVAVHVDLELTGSIAAKDLRVSATVAGQEVAATPNPDGSVFLEVTVPDVERWWPVGHGSPTLYMLDVCLTTNAHPLDAWSARIGFREVQIVETPDDQGTRWAIHVNGKRVRIRGFNWIPDDPFPNEVDGDRYRERIDQALGANANLLRVWGGGLYETADFYDACDERGVLVWQDFAFACAAYPETDDVIEQVELEARQQVTRLSPHPSLVLWNGNNECVWGWHDWGWREELNGAPWGAHYYTELLPAIIAELDPTRPYLAGSPWSGSLDAPPADPRHGVTHLWTIWNDVDYADYRSFEPSFVAEFGWQGPPTWTTLQRAVPEGDLLPSNPVVQHHQRALDGMNKLSRGLQPHFPEPTNADDWHWATSLNQARAVALGIEHLRSVERCGGAIVWQLNDCWPVLSWAAVDGDGKRKPVWYAIRRAFAPRLATLKVTTDGLVLALINDTSDDWRGEAQIRRVALDGRVLAHDEVSLICAADGLTATPLARTLSTPADPGGELLVVDLEDQRIVHAWKTDRELAYPAPKWTAKVADSPEGATVTISADTLLRDFTILADRLGEHPVPTAAVDEQLVTLLPGESTCFEVHGIAGLQAKDVVRPAVWTAADVAGSRA